jgi:nitroreductase
MFENMDHSHGVALDEVLTARHSVRAFSPTPLEKEEINQIIRAGSIAPFAAMAVGGKQDFRKFFIIPAGSPMGGKVRDIIMDRFPKYLEEIEQSAGPVPFVKMLKANGSNIIAGLSNKPCLVIVGEMWGIPAIVPESLSYCIENMWLKATSMKIGFQLLSIISGMKLGNDRDLCQLLDIRPGEYYLDGFAMGYPASNYKPAPVKYPDLGSCVKWL